MARWIPVDERLPEPNQLVVKTRKYYLVQDEYGDMLTASYNKRADGFIYWEQMYDIEPLHYEVVAWMELPEPYERSNTAKPWSEGDEKELFELVRKVYADANRDYLTEQIQQACRYCANNPQNGGNGFCNCTLGQAVIY